MVWAPDAVSSQDRFVETKHLGHLRDGVFEIGQRLAVTCTTPDPARRAGKLPMQLGERVTLDLKSRERTTLQLNDRNVAITCQHPSPFIFHLPMIAGHARRHVHSAAVLICRDPGGL
jgi:hypothetical protein